MIIPEGKKEREVLKEEFYKKQIKEEKILTLINIVALDYRHTIEILDRNKGDTFEMEEEEKDILYNQIYKGTENLLNLLIEIYENHSKKCTEFEEKRRDIMVSEGGVIAEAIIEDRENMKNIPPNKKLFQEIEELINHSQYSCMKLRRTFDYNKWQIVDRTNKNKVRFEGTPEEVAKTIREITQGQ